MMTAKLLLKLDAEAKGNFGRLFLKLDAEGSQGEFQKLLPRLDTEAKGNFRRFFASRMP
jgi:hypothetical protein